jgi:hypothetical protein
MGLVHRNGIERGTMVYIAYVYMSGAVDVGVMKEKKPCARAVVDVRPYPNWSPTFTPATIRD